MFLFKPKSTRLSRAPQQARNEASNPANWRSLHYLFRPPVPSTVPTHRLLLTYSIHEDTGVSQATPRLARSLHLIYPTPFSNASWLEN